MQEYKMKTASNAMSTRPFSILQFVSEYADFVASRSTMNVKEFDNFVLPIHGGMDSHK